MILVHQFPIVIVDKLRISSFKNPFKAGNPKTFGAVKHY
jgi:hypothetical protein